ncbi:hypothetical protein [Bifidobacterium callitrichidarum]|uniref:Uncharacterized protein n=1 Tax=Bifidobacterium callitrichidarum TaxID=2052941 RepID=A0A2U2N8S4_9BIFI|nr:hypothetical protein [Bifidobacterium callitrichidarum]PWG65585.1 hypothetical protein DF196_06525 [Bifidobacterium callitrichidarum]
MKRIATALIAVISTIALVTTIFMGLLLWRPNRTINAILLTKYEDWSLADKRGLKLEIQLAHQRPIEYRKLAEFCNGRDNWTTYSKTTMNIGDSKWVDIAPWDNYGFTQHRIIQGKTTGNKIPVIIQYDCSSLQKPDPYPIALLHLLTTTKPSSRNH